MSVFQKTLFFKCKEFYQFVYIIFYCFMIFLWTRATGVLIIFFDLTPQQQATSDFNYVQPVESAQPQTYQIIDVPQEQNAEVPQWNQSPPPPPQTTPVEHPSNSFPNYVMYSEPSIPGSSYIYTSGYSPCVYYTIPPAFSS